MLFQFYYGGYGGGRFGQVGDLMQRYGLFDVFLPFIFVYVIVYASLQQLKIFKYTHKTKDPSDPTKFKYEDKSNKRINSIISFVISLLFVAPHITSGTYNIYSRTFGFDPVVVMNQMIPYVGVILVMITLVLVVLGLLGFEDFSDTEGTGVPRMIGIGIAMLMIAVAFIHALGIWPWLTSKLFFLNDSSLVMFLVFLAAFVLIATFATGD